MTPPLRSAERWGADDRIPAPGQKMEGVGGRKFFAREPSAKPCRPCLIEGKAEQKNTFSLDLAVSNF